MKKILVVLLVLAVAGGVFAQDGSWSVSGRVEAGTLLNFLDVERNGEYNPTIGGSAYNMYGYYGSQTGEVGLTYSRDDFRLGMSFNNTDPIGLSMSYASDDMAFEASQDLQDLLNGTWKPGRLWGWFKFMDGQLHLEAAVDSRDTKWWVSSEVVGQLFDDYFLSDGGIARHGTGTSFAHVDHENYLLANFAPMDGFEVGILIPGVFAASNNGPAVGQDPWDLRMGTGQRRNTGIGSNKGSGIHDHIGNQPWANEFLLENVVMGSIIGMKYTGMEGLNVALQLIPDLSMWDRKNIGAENEKTLGLYFGAEYRVNSQIAVDVGYTGAFGYGDEKKGEESEIWGWFGLGARFSDGPLSAYGRFGMDFNTEDDFNNTIAIGVGASYNIIPTHLAFGVDAVFHISDNYDKKSGLDANGLHWVVIPQLHFNFMGTGAGIGYWWPNNTGILVRYHFESSNVVNALDVTFKFSF